MHPLKQYNLRHLNNSFTAALKKTEFETFKTSVNETLFILLNNLFRTAVEVLFSETLCTLLNYIFGTAIEILVTV